MKPEQPALVQELLVVADEHARVLGALGELAQDRHDLARAAHRLVVADGGEITTRPLRQGAHCLALLARADQSTLRALPCAPSRIALHVATDGQAAPRTA